MNEDEAIQNAEVQLDRWMRARAFLASGQAHRADYRDTDDRMMDLDEAFDRLSAVASSERAHEVLEKIGQAMMGKLQPWPAEDVARRKNSTLFAGDYQSRNGLT